jgi:hypothetical protein
LAHKEATLLPGKIEYKGTPPEGGADDRLKHDQDRTRDSLSTNTSRSR